MPAVAHVVMCNIAMLIMFMIETWRDSIEW